MYKVVHIYGKHKNLNKKFSEIHKAFEYIEQIKLEQPYLPMIIVKGYEIVGGFTKDWNMCLNKQFIFKEK